MGQQVHMVALLAVLSAAVAVPHAMGSGHPDQAASVAAVLSAMQGPGLGGAYQKMMGHKHTLSQGHLERSLAFIGVCVCQGGTVAFIVTVVLKQQQQQQHNIPMH